MGFVLVGTAGLVTVAGLVMVEKRREARLHETTRGTLLFLQDLLASKHVARFTGTAEDATGQVLLRRLIGRVFTFGTDDATNAVVTLLVGGVALDAWGHPIYYRCPGPVHKNGWDLISCGPDGVYENGEGDDIVVGEDLPGGVASVTSEGK